jgi:hypothetical protein
LETTSTISLVNNKNKRGPSNITPLYMNDDVLEDVLKHKHLGINFCPNGTWKDQINEIYKKGCSRLNKQHRLSF